MKKILTLFIIIIISQSLNAQSLFNKESKLIHLGAGLGAFNFRDCFVPLPLINLTYDQGLLDDIGIGNIGVGGTVGIKHYINNCITVGGSSRNWNRIYIGARAHYHFNFIESDKLDLYAGFMAGVFFWTGDKTIGNYPSPTSLLPGAFAGLNYWLKPNIGVFAEVGYGVGLVNGGLSIGLDKLKIKK